MQSPRRLHMLTALVSWMIPELEKRVEMAAGVLQYPQILQHRTWFGFNATVTLRSKFMHKTGFGNLLILHPAAVNWLLRRGLNTKNVISLSIQHEVGHLQTVPFALLYAGILLLASWGEGSMAWFKIPFFVVSTQAAWEITSELYTIFRDIESYRACYDGVQKLARIIFWLLSVLMAFTGALILLF